MKTTKLRVFNAVLIAALALSLVAFVQPAQAVSPDIVISQVYGGGGNSGAPYNSDFIELYNRGTTTVSLVGWSVQYASQLVPEFGANRNSLTTVLAPGQYWLVQEAAGQLAQLFTHAQCHWQYCNERNRW